MDLNPTPRPLCPNRRILVVDDNPAIHEDVRKILCPSISPAAATLATIEAALLGGGSPGRAPAPTFSVDSALQGREGLALVESAIAAQQPHAMAFVDVRMPPGWDGVETALALWKVAPDLQIVICTAYSDYSWDEMLARLGSSDRLVILRKPFDAIEVMQLANALTEKWNLLRQTRAHARDLEAAVRERTEDLRAEIARRAALETDLVRAKESAEAADRAKSAFLANMSHEIRTPMNGVIGMANLLLATPLNAEQHDFVTTLAHSSDTLLTIINDILDFSKIEAGRLNLETIDFDLSEAVRLAIDLHADAAAKKGLELVMEISPAVPTWVRGDPVRLRQVLLNLIGNAIKFTAQGEVVVQVEPVPLDDGASLALRFEVNDTGTGISSDVQPLLFEPFVQADTSTTRRFGGTGLGLAICKRLVELMHGQITVVSAPGEGSIFSFTVEFERSFQRASKITRPALELKGRRVLAVDDNAANRLLLDHLLTRWGAQRSVVDSADAALRELRRATAVCEPPELILLDCGLPDMDGLELAAAIRATGTKPEPILVLLSSRGERLTPEQLAIHGLAACELKPIYPDKLRETLGGVLSQARREARPEPPAAVPDRTCSRSGPILVAEDNTVNQKVIVLMLRRLGYDADVAPNGREALAALRRKRYALVLMDEQMPEMDGLETARRIRRGAAAGEPAFPADLPMIAVTADAMAGTRERCLAAGMDDYLAKPVQLEALRLMLKTHLNSPAATTAEPLAT